jgi:hypothetical protein
MSHRDALSAEDQKNSREDQATIEDSEDKGSILLPLLYVFFKISVEVGK